MKLEINEKFENAIKLMNDTNQNVFITGKAGTGKSTLLKYFRNITSKNIAVVAPTGVSAVNVEGQTIHSFFGFKPDITYEKIKPQKGEKKKVIEKLDALIIDEVSMVRADLFDFIDKALKLNRKNHDQPFGGVQMILFGDLYQLPPIIRNDERAIFFNTYSTPFFFSSLCFKESIFNMVELEKVYRQKDDEFIDILGRIRNKTITFEDLDILNKRFDPSFIEAKNKNYVSLTTINKKAEFINNTQLANIKGRLFEYPAKVSGSFTKNSFPTEENLRLKIGSQLMLLNNDSDGRWVNGSVGTLEEIVPGEDDDKLRVKLQNGMTVDVDPYKWDIFRFLYDDKEKQINSESVGSFTQYPVKLAWAVTIHKAQGKTFENVVLDLSSGVFAPGQTYVALSRCVSLKGLVLKTKIRKSHVFIDERIKRFFASADEIFSDNQANRKLF